MLDSDLKRVKDLLESEKISDIGAKMAVESPYFAFDGKNDTYFTFREVPVSKNNKVYRTITFKTKMSLKFLSILMSDSFELDLDNCPCPEEFQRDDVGGRDVCSNAW